MLKIETVLDVVRSALEKAKLGELKLNRTSVLLSTGTERFIVRVRPKRAKAKKMVAKKATAKKPVAKKVPAKAAIKAVAA